MTGQSDGGVDPLDPAGVVRAWLADSEITHEEIGDGVFALELPGERKLRTPCRLDVGPHALGVHAFVCRNPDENHRGVYRWMLERNLRMYAVAFGVDAAGDIYLDARLPLATVTAEELDRVVGSVLVGVGAAVLGDDTVGCTEGVGVTVGSAVEPKSDISSQPARPTAASPATTTPITIAVLFGLAGWGGWPLGAPGRPPN